jgi:hypothetical protein
MVRLKCRVLHTDKRRTMAGSVYQAPQRRFAVDGTCQMERRTDSKKVRRLYTYEWKGRVSRAHLVDKGNVDLYRTQTVVNVDRLAANVGTR